MPLEHAILAFTNFAPMTGYDLKKYLDQSVSHFWSVTQSHIYKSLERLEKEGWVESEIVPQEGKPNRKVYTITPAGKEELHLWLAAPRPLGKTRNDWLIQIFFAHTLSNEEIIHLLEVRAQAIRETLKIYRTDIQASLDENRRQSGEDRAGELWQMTLDYGIVSYEAELHWLEKTIERVHNLPPLPLPQTN